MAEESSPGSDRPSLNRVAQIAEVIASLAVVVTLIFLVAEVRRNTEVVQAASYGRSMEALNLWRISLAADAELSATWLRAGASPGVEDDPEQVRLSLMLNVLWGIYENAYFDNERGLLGTSEWSRFERQICVRYGIDRSRWGTTSTGLRSLLTEEFADFTEASCG